MADGLPGTRDDSARTPTPTQTPTFAELAFANDRARFALIAKYPVRPIAVLTPGQLTAARAELGLAAFFAPTKPSRRDQDRHPLTADELRDARAAAS